MVQGEASGSALKIVASYGDLLVIHPIANDQDDMTRLIDGSDGLLGVGEGSAGAE